MMASLTAAGRKMQAEMLVFDKDGLMFDAQIFWRELVNTRAAVFAQLFSDPEMAVRWARFTFADTSFREGAFVTDYVDPMGITAVAPPNEEITATAAFLCEHCGLKWPQARERAEALFARADALLDLRRAVRPMPGYVDLMTRLIERGIPYCVATSDTYQRTRDSMELFGFFKDARFVITKEDVANGKPAPDMLLEVSRRAGVDVTRLAMVGDSYVDVKMAQNAGCIGIGVSKDERMKREMAPFATVVLDSLVELVVD